MTEPTSALMGRDEVTVRAALRRLEAQEVERIARAEAVGMASTGALVGILDAVRSALARLDAATYGRCVGCDGAIEPMRLEVLPYAERCLGCQARTERSTG